MTRTLCFIAALGFAMPCWAAGNYHMGNGVTVKVGATVENSVMLPEIVCTWPEDQRPDGVLCDDAPTVTTEEQAARFAEWKNINEGEMK